MLERCDLGGTRWTVLRDSGRSFFADPFPVCRNGKTFLFFEEFEYRLGKGVISAIEFDAAGPVGPPLRVLEEPWHLSYPFIMEHGDALFMIPEASLTGEVPLYRCTAFPDRWERVGSIITGIEASDCTLFRHDGLLWMTSSTREGVGGYSDTLSIHFAPDIFGPWTEHEQRPILVDAGFALVRRGGSSTRMAASGGRSKTARRAMASARLVLARDRAAGHTEVRADLARARLAGTVVAGAAPAHAQSRRTVGSHRRRHHQPEAAYRLGAFRGPWARQIQSNRPSTTVV